MRLIQSLGSVAVVVSILLSNSGHAAQATLQWQPTLENAKRLAAQTNRLVLVHFWADWCQPCRKMQRDILSRPEVISELQASYVPVKINADHFPTTCRQFGVTGLPADVIISPQGQVLGKLRLVSTPSEYIAQLRQAATQPPPNAYAQTPAASRPPGPTYSNLPAPTHPNVPGAANPSVDPTADASRYTYPGYGNQYGPSQPPSTQPPGRRDQSQGNTQGMPPYGRSATPPNASRQYSSYGTPPGPGSPTTTMPPARTPSPSASTGAYAGASAPTSNAPAAEAPIALNRHCPVELAENRRWMLGNRQWGSQYEGRTYLFAGQPQWRKFMANPAQYAPVISGDDLVAAVDQHRRVAGDRSHGVYFENKVYLFANEANLEKFAKNPQFYINSTVRAARPVDRG
ncbi:MAG: thioredoxin family protein [Candidatus Nealsonbacteria bacterium]|nr:thioredoxin family protein [Candidatus Nealsonbacteria bacterium]